MLDSVMPTYNRLPLTFSRGEGVWLWDTEGNRYLDAISGIAVCALGHAHPALAEAVCQQAKRLWHTSNLYGIEHQEALASELAKLSGLDNAFFCNSGAEANEAAIKIARAYGHQNGISHPKILVMENSFHGRTLATLSATGNSKVQKGFEPLVEGFVRIPFNSIEPLQALASQDDIVAILVEPIQGEGGVQVPAIDYLSRLRNLCDQHDWLLMLDEVQTGMGRTGQWFGFQRENLLPDVITIAKALGNGFPIGACLARGKAAHVLQPGMHGSTFGGNPLACRVAMTVIELIKQQSLLERAQCLGRMLLDEFTSQLAGCPWVRDIRGRGLMIGIELEKPCGFLVQEAINQNLLINVTADRVIRLLPPLILSESEAHLLVATLSNLIQGIQP